MIYCENNYPAKSGQVVIYVVKKIAYMVKKTTYVVKTYCGKYCFINTNCPK